jgi:transcriptional regulator with XRE-family HTH domain
MGVTRMELTHPIDTALRARVKAFAPNQAEFAAAIGRSAGWLNKYMHGAGNATVDDVVRMVALLIGVETQPLTETERKLLRALRRLEDPQLREDVLAYAELRAKRAAPQPTSRESSARESHTPLATSRKGRDKRRAGKE